MKTIVLLRVVILVCVSALVSACGAMVVGGAADGGYNKRATAETGSDAHVTATINALYVKDPDVNALDINVVTDRGVVVLRGHVHDANVRSRAITIARGVQGVTRVDSHIEVLGH